MNQRMRLRRLWLIVPYVVFGLLLVGGLSAVLQGLTMSPAYDAMFGVPSVVGLIYSVRAARDRSVDRAARRPWWLLAGYFGVSLVLGAAFGLLLQGDRSSADVQSSAQIVIRAVEVPLLLMALLSFARDPLSRAERVRLACDGVVVAGGGFMMVWFLYVSSPLIPDTTAVRITALVFPLFDLTMLLGICAVLVRGVRADGTRAVPVLLLGILGSLAGDLYMIYQSSYVAGWHADGPVYLMSAITLMTLAASAVERTRPHRRHQAGGRLRPSRRIRWAPHFALAAGLALLFAAALDAHPATMVGLVCGAVAMVAGVMARQLLALRENEFLLTRDSLTGLANRVELAKSLRAALAQSARKGSRVGVLLIDLNGFKQVNDTYGHAAGDQLLVSFGEVLRAHVRAGDTPARLGGDEFAVIMAGLEGAAEAMGVADRVVAAAAATRPLEGLPVGIRASIGVCLSAPSTNGRPAAIDAAAEDVLRRADAAMYRAKRAGGEGWLLASGTGLVHTADPARDPVVVAG